MSSRYDARCSPRSASWGTRAAALVFALYGLTPNEVQLLPSTAPPRDPLALVEGTKE